MRHQQEAAVRKDIASDHHGVARQTLGVANSFGIRAQSRRVGLTVLIADTVSLPIEAVRIVRQFVRGSISEREPAVLSVVIVRVQPDTRSAVRVLEPLVLPLDFDIEEAVRCLADLEDSSVRIHESHQVARGVLHILFHAVLHRVDEILTVCAGGLEEPLRRACPGRSHFERAASIQFVRYELRGAPRKRHIECAVRISSQLVRILDRPDRRCRHLRRSFDYRVDRERSRLERELSVLHIYVAYYIAFSAAISKVDEPYFAAALAVSKFYLHIDRSLDRDLVSVHVDYLDIEESRIGSSALFPAEGVFRPCDVVVIVFLVVSDLLDRESGPFGDARIAAVCDRDRVSISIRGYHCLFQVLAFVAIFIVCLFFVGAGLHIFSSCFVFCVFFVFCTCIGSVFGILSIRIRILFLISFRICN